MKPFQVIQIKNTPIICNIPHGSTRIPPEFARDFLLSKSELKIEASRLADLYSAELFKPLLKHYGGIIANFSRIVTDIERFEDDKHENMSKVGMGALYTKSESGKVIRTMTSATKKHRLNILYRPYHKAFNHLVRGCLDKFGHCLILDCHTFPSITRQYEPDKRSNRPDICLGSDNFHTPNNLLTNLKKNFSQNFTVGINHPFSGTIVPLEYYQKNKSVQSIMIEVNRKLYMNEKTFSKTIDFKKISTVVCRTIVSSLEDA